MSIGSVIAEAESSAIDKVYEHISSCFGESTQEPHKTKTADICDVNCLARMLEEKAMIGNYMCSIGATCGTSKSYMCDLDDDVPGSNANIIDLDMSLDEIDLDEFMVSSADIKSYKGVNAEKLSKIWRIDLQTAKRTLDVTSQNCSKSHGSSLSRNYSTNDRMLRYKRIHQYFFMDTFFATKKAKSSSRGYTCMQLFVTDKGFVHVVPMKKKSEVIYALKQFAKEIGAPDAIVFDASGEQTSLEVKHFCQDIGTSLQVPEERTHWTNRAELCIGLLKKQ